MSERDAFIRAICERPAEDAVRLVYADWLDESAGHIKCPRCGGTGEGVKLNDSGSAWRVCDCDGTGRISDGQRECAAYIRASVGGARGGSFLPDSDSQLINRCGIEGFGRTRGFINHIELTCENFMGHAAEIFATFPITEVAIIDKYPDQPADAGFWRWWWHPEEPGGWRDKWRSELPGVLYEAVYDPVAWPSDSRNFRSSNDALAALSRACVAYGRKLAGLSPLAEAA